MWLQYTVRNQVSNSTACHCSHQLFGQLLKTNATPHGASNGDKFPGNLCTHLPASWLLILQKHSGDYTNSQLTTFSEIVCQKCTTHGFTLQSTSNNTRTLSSPGDSMLGMNCSMSSFKRLISNVTSRLFNYAEMWFFSSKKFCTWNLKTLHKQNGACSTNWQL